MSSDITLSDRSTYLLVLKSTLYYVNVCVI